MLPMPFDPSSCGFLVAALAAGVVACGSHPSLHPPTPEQAARLDSLKRDSNAVAACAKLTGTDPQAIHAEQDVEKPARLLTDQRRPFDPPRRDGNAVGVVVVRADGSPDRHT